MNSELIPSLPLVTPNRTKDIIFGHYNSKPDIELCSCIRLELIHQRQITKLLKCVFLTHILWPIIYGINQNIAYSKLTIDIQPYGSKTAI